MKKEGFCDIQLRVVIERERQLTPVQLIMIGSFLSSKYKNFNICGRCSGISNIDPGEGLHSMAGYQG